MRNQNNSVRLTVVGSTFTLLLMCLIGQGYSQVMPAPSGIPDGMGGVPSQKMMPPGFQIPKMVEGKYVNSEYGIEMVFAEGLKGMETSTAGSTSIIAYFDGGPGGMIGGSADMTGNPKGSSLGAMPDMTMIVVSLIDTSRTEQANDTASTLLGSNVTNLQDIKINKTELPKIDCKPGSPETVNIGGKSARASSSECSITSSNPKGTMYMKSKDYLVDLGDGKSASLRYSVMSSSSSTSAASAYDTNLSKFEDSVRTITFTK
jgi:hypothetical protein